MTAKEFYKENKGKYFMYKECRVRVVGFDIDDNNSLPIMIAHKDGWWNFPYDVNESIEYVVDESLINDGDMGEWVSIESLIPIEEELNLCELLKGCEGVTLYSPIFGDVILTSVNKGLDYPITVSLSDKCSRSFYKNGLYLNGYNAECMLFPSKENRDWSTFKRGPFICSGGTAWILKKNRPETYTYVVPVSEFNFDDFEANKVGKYKQS